jgi:hypothetical protein
MDQLTFGAVRLIGTPYKSKLDHPLYLYQVQIPTFMQNRKILIYVTKEIIVDALN